MTVPPDLKSVTDHPELRGADVSISVVSHDQMGLVVHLLDGLESHCRPVQIEVILTLNLNESLSFDPGAYSYPIIVLRNACPKGFAANHNQAFTHASGRNFCVINPDIRFSSEPFGNLLACLEDISVGAVAPLVWGKGGNLEVTARRFPSPLKLLGKLVGMGWQQDYLLDCDPVYPDWIGGMFMLFPRRVFDQLAGFDERYFLYYEDVDICARLRLLGYQVEICTAASVIHHAQRQSHHDFRYLSWHVGSIARFFLSPVYWKLKLLQTHGDDGRMRKP